MYITPHATIGIIIGERVGNPILGFALGVFSHFICDIIPHGDTQFDDWAHKTFKSQKKVIYVLATIDYAAMLVMLWWIAPTLTLTPSVVAATIGTIAPDMIWAWYDVSRWKCLAWYKKMHHDVHKILPRDIPYWFGLLYQVILVIFLISIRTTA